MSMIGYVLGLTPAQIDELKKTPRLTRDLTLVAADDTRRRRMAAIRATWSAEQRQAADAAEHAMQAQSWAKDAARLLAEARARTAPLGPFEPALDLEKSWHILHFLFTGHAGDEAAPGNALLAGEPLGADLGYGPARVHDAAATREFAGFLATQDVERLRERVNYRQMSRARLYGLPMGNAPESEFEAELGEEVATYFPALRNYVAGMAEKGDALLVWLS